MCVLSPGEHDFDTITIASGGSLLLQGDEVTKTRIKVNKIVIHPGGILAAENNGYHRTGPGVGAVTGAGGSYGGNGGKVSDTSLLYGDMLRPSDYGSGGYGATTSGGCGGGQVELIVADSLINDGTIDMSGVDGATSTQGGGSGGSIYIEAPYIQGYGSFLATGGSSSAGGGGGGRITFNTSQSMDATFGGVSLISGGQGAVQNGGAGEDITLCISYVVCR